MPYVSVYVSSDEYKLLEEKYKEAKKLYPELPFNHFMRNLIRIALGLEPVKKPKEKLMYELFGDMARQMDAFREELVNTKKAVKELTEIVMEIVKEIEILEKRTPGLDKMLKKQDKKSLERLLERLK